MKSLSTTMKSSPCSPQLETDCVQQDPAGPNIKKKLIKKKAFLLLFDSCSISGQGTRSCVLQLIFTTASESRVRLFAIPWTVVCQAPLSMEFYREEYWSGLPSPSPGDLPDQGSNPGLLHRRQIL